MAYYLLTLVFALVLFTISFTLRGQLNRLPKIVQRPFYHSKKSHHEGHHPEPVCPRQEKSQHTSSTRPAGKPYHMTMKLKRLDLNSWLTVDSEYLREHTIRKELLDKSLSNVLQCLPGSELACVETLDLVVDFLVSTYPDTFVLEGVGKDLAIRIIATQEIFSLVDVVNPLELAARLAKEDFNILMKDPEDQQYHLIASATLFPVGWKLQERIGGTMAALHKTVPNWQEKLSCLVDRYFDRVSLTGAMERKNTFVQIGHTLFQTEAQPSQATPESILTPASDIMLRNERQTFRRLPESNAILFTVHTFMYPITELSDEELIDFVEQMRGWPPETAFYKGRDFWGPAVLRYSAERLGNKVPC